MIAKNVSREDLTKALDRINKKYKGNIEFWKLESINAAGDRFLFRLRVKSSKLAGARRSTSGKRMISACWHVHGYYFEALLQINPKAVIKSGRDIVIDIDGGNWQDRNIGSLIEPMYFSTACECKNDSH